ncbi:MULTISPECIES: DUF3050 domain-containing protein [unclassified Burkholderia]|uniref:DUF3050 domain-containing protein n=1 Tax=unclassified Burkholderia TaxID=2613784 RepID=UPI00075D68E4|nr:MULTISPECIES: DUF3050 domain-containing protein [unclassified Burkholderia]KUY50666.1 mangotoxin biosynthesis-involved protein MgoB [Burkholderia sp. RF2-non_BP3]KUY81439.1 mangotoxin biosynthesis-involved protein MgoB [Burkholderia sp. RF4-BP95]KUY96707.1 mangotoxin biosynthesis-involved protein MgoB [Burkholderia sp. RF7-non_BP4]KUZ02922.1 mangotoxin biosynthesis-involved protein MgoB [Burkholderia sp. RF7-non_BP1]
MENFEARLSTIETAIAMQRRLLVNHPVFNAIQSHPDLRTFMEWHVYAVWDFMSLLKRLQNDLTCVSVPWIPACSGNTTRLINEIVLGEECDHTPLGFMSHFDLYMHAMRDIGASPSRIQHFIKLVRAGVDVNNALIRVEAPLPIQTFVNTTLRTCEENSTHEVLGAFLFGREDIIPDMFRTLLDRWRVDHQQIPLLNYYLRRHIQVDDAEHGPAARTLIQDVTGGEPHKLEATLKAGFIAVTARIKLWDALNAHLRAQPSAVPPG